MRRRPIVGVLLGGTMLATLSGWSSSATGSPSAAPTDTTTTWIDLAYLGHVVTDDMATVTGANVTYSTALNAAFADLESQERKLTLDYGAIQADRFALGCNPSDTTGYASCQASELQLVTNAQNDAATAQARVDADFQEARSAASTYQSALRAFIGQMLALPWPSAINRYVNTLVISARSYRRDIAREAAVSPATPQSSLSAFAAQSGVDVAHFNAAISALKAAFHRQRT
jgi:hypothetical protein